MTLQPRFDIEIEAPDGAAALDLERRLWRLAPTAVGRGSHWYVEVPSVRCPTEVETVVRRWLDEIGEPETTMRVDARRLRVAGRHATCEARFRGPNAHFIG